MVQRASVHNDFVKEHPNQLHNQKPIGTPLNAQYV